MHHRKPQPLSLSDVEIRGTAIHTNRRQSANATKEFIAWDGEAVQDGGYCLMGNSKGEYLKGKELGTLEMLELIVESGKRHPKAFHVAFAFDYDVNNILRDIGWVRIAVLHKTGTVRWEGYELKHIPSKSFTVSLLDKGGKPDVTVRIDDVFTYFRSRFDKALIKYDIGSEKEQGIVTAGKEERGDFKWADIDEIQTYWEMELDLMVKLMDRLRADVNAAGFFIGQWHGPGALAAYSLKSRGMAKHKLITPDDVLEPVRIAYSGGWFERFKVGVHDGPVYTADINSAYAYGISQLPSLATGEWRYVSKVDPQMAAAYRFAIFHIRIDKNEKSFAQWVSTCHGTPMPLFIRDSNGQNSHPVVVDGWYWGPEAMHVIGHPYAEWIEAWVFDDDGTYPFEWVQEMYDERLLLKDEGNPAEKALKWTMASLYGRVAQRAGWNQRERKAPRWHQLDWAGYITSLCRSMLFEASYDVSLNGGLISNDTDGVMSTVPFGRLRNGKGKGLGQWEMEEFSGVIYIQNGVYWLRDKETGQWKEPKLRGIPTGKIKDPVDGPPLAMEALSRDGVIRFSRRNFVGYGAALRGRRGEWRTWVEREMTIDAYHSGNRQHIEKLCRACMQGLSLTECMHDLALVPTKDMESRPHKLPWLEEVGETTWEMVRHMLDAGDM